MVGPLIKRRRRVGRRTRAVARPYVLIIRGPDGRPRAERFDDAAGYRARLATLERSRDTAVSLDDVIGLLDA